MTCFCVSDVFYILDIQEVYDLSKDESVNLFKSFQGCAAAALSRALLLAAAARKPATLLARLDDAMLAALAAWHSLAA